MSTKCCVRVCYDVLRLTTSRENPGKVVRDSDPFPGMATMMALQPRAARRLALLLRLSPRAKSSTTTVTIGGVTKEVRAASRPELVPSGFLPKEDENVPPETRDQCSQCS